MFWKLILKLFGWKINYNLPKGFEKSVTIASPHTSNWDFLFAYASFKILKVPMKFTIKKEWFKFPFNLILNRIGGIAIDRTPKNKGDKKLSMVDAMANAFEGQSEFVIMITPEGTRSLRTEWKSGFYHIAKKAGVPISLSYLDYKKKEAGIAKLIYPSDDMEKDLREVMAFYKNIHAKHPQKFSVDKRYI